MTTVIFVHGISVREPKFSEDFKEIQDNFCKELEKQELKNIKITPCLWGNSLGAILNGNLASIPPYDSNQIPNQSSKDNENFVRWILLERDTFYELRVLSLKTPKESSASSIAAKYARKKQELNNKVKNFSPSDNLRNQFQNGGITEEVFKQARHNVVNSELYQKALNTISDTLTEHRDAFARAIIAEVMAICKDAAISSDPVLRDQVIESFSKEIAPDEAGIMDWLGTQVFNLGTCYLKPRRRENSEIINPFVGDILLYQGRGQKIRGLIKSYIEEAEPPVVLLAHSLGGVACVDLLIKEKLEQVNLLVTVGSQAPYFYEIGALQSLECGQPLPEHFPSWLNIYDSRDFLSYIGEGVFPDKVKDFQVDNGEPFWPSHNAYWRNTATWEKIVTRIKAL